MAKKILLSLLIVISLYSASWADIVYATSDGKLGSIIVASSSDISLPVVEYESRISEPRLLSYWTGSASSVMLIQNYASASGDRAYVFDPSNLSELRASRDIKGVFGTTNADYADNGRSIFLSAGPDIYEVSTSDFNVVRSYDCNGVISRDGETTEIESLLVDYDTISVIASAGTTRKFIRFDGQLKKDVSYFMSRDVDSGASYLDVVNNVTLISHSTGISSLNFRDEFRKILSTDYPVAATCADDESGFYYATCRSADTAYIFTLTSSANSSTKIKFESVDIVSTQPNISLMRDDTQNVLAVMTDEGILIYDIKTGIQVRDYDVSQLGGKPVGITLAKVSGSSSSRSSGCNSLSTSLILIALTGFMLRRK